MNETVIKFYDEETSEERLAKISECFHTLKTENLTVKRVGESKVFFVTKSDVTVTCDNHNIYLRIDEASKAIGKNLSGGDELEVTTISFSTESDPILVMFKNITKNITIVNVKALQVANYIEKQIKENQITYNGIISNLRHNEYLGLLVKSESQYVELLDIFNVKELTRENEDMRKMFARNTYILPPKSISIGKNQMYNTDFYHLYFFQYDEEHNVFFDGEDTYCNISDIFIKLDVYYREFSMKNNVLWEDI